ncbi:GntR family transcriptional regulator [Puniceibacterium sp. IMCC21224]|uniref:GntR family transcriptional regulator n=1 Tax=Puniceibacterium sp. IMCC21224 TaxID=1618204 RepID=UPI00064D8455|nr:GntR family transcriptional regulator [Puniceibacterium sp. IMCC21224]KMK67747.1 transcriptional regulator, GntR family [Puniceibacterium sp. IMCC21224]
MPQATRGKDRRSSVERIVEYLYDEITSMRLLPGTRISETEIASRFGVSRQPARDAFNQLEHMDLITIRPKRATEVRKFSAAAIEKSRFVRAAVETAALRRAAVECDDAGRAALDACLALQKAAIARGNRPAFARLDYDFHRTLCDVGKVSFAYDVIKTEKEKVDRLCTLELSKGDWMQLLIEDHESIANAVKLGDQQAAVDAGMRHLRRLDDTIKTIRINSATYFEPDPE